MPRTAWLMWVTALASCGGVSITSRPADEVPPDEGGVRLEACARVELPPPTDAAPRVVVGPYRVREARAFDDLSSWGGYPLYLSPGGETLVTSVGGRYFVRDVASQSIRSVHRLAIVRSGLAALSPDGAMLAVVGSLRDERSRLQVVATEDDRLLLDVASDGASVRFSPDGRRVMTDGAVFDVATAERVWTAPRNAVRSCLAPPTSARCLEIRPLLSGTGTIEARAEYLPPLQDTHRTRWMVEVKRFDGRAGSRFVVEDAPSGVQLFPDVEPPLVAVLGRRVRLLSTAAPERPIFERTFDRGVRALRWEPADGVVVANVSAGLANPAQTEIRVLDAATGNERFRREARISDAFDVAAGTLLHARSNEPYEVLDLVDGAHLRTLPESVRRFTRDGWSMGFGPVVLDPEGRARLEAPSHPRLDIEELSRDGRRWLLSDLRIIEEEECLRVGGAAAAARFSPDGRRLFVVSPEHQTMTAVNLESRQLGLAIRIAAPGAFLGLPLSDAFLTQPRNEDVDDELVVVDAVTGAVRRRIRAPRRGYRVVGSDPVPASRSPYPAHLYSPSREIAGDRILTNYLHFPWFSIWDLTRDEHAEHYDAELEPERADVADDGTLLALGGRLGGVRIIRLSPTVSALGQLEMPGSVTAVRVSPDGTRVAIASDDGALRIVTVDGATVEAEIDFGARHDWVTHLSFQGDDGLIAFTERGAIVVFARARSRRSPPDVDRHVPGPASRIPNVR